MANCDDSSDDEVIIVSTSGARVRKAPCDIDGASWYLIQQLQAEEEEQQRKTCYHRTKEGVLNLLTPLQLQAVNYVKEKAKTMHEASLPELQDRVKSLGFTSEELKQCLEYIQDDAPIVIHFKEETLSLLVNDTHYRNVFETKTTGGNKDIAKRSKWEATMFGNCYGKSAFDRPKYGSLNYAGDIQGVYSARRYGDLFLILQPTIRYRCTFFNKDTSRFVADQTLATNEYYAHVLNAYDDSDLSAVLNVCMSARVGGTRCHCHTYKEVQVHGPICLATDVLALSVPGRERTASKKFKTQVLEFQKKTNCNVLWQEDLLNTEE